MTVTTKIPNFADGGIVSYSGPIILGQPRTPETVLPISVFKQKPDAVICTCGESHLSVNAAASDPTRTLTLRNSFAADMGRRFNWLARLVTQAIVEQDVFAISQPRIRTFKKKLVTNRNPLPTGTLPGNRAFEFNTAPEKVEKFMQWLNTQVEKGILETRQIQQLGTATNEAWTNLYIQDSYKRGLIRARYEMSAAGYPVPPLEETGGIAASMSTPFHAERAGLLYTRTFQELRGITAAMDSQISRVLAQGIADGDGPVLLARKLRRTITGPSGDLSLTDTLGRFIPAKRRAEILARTEIIRAHHAATVQEYRNWAVAGVKVKAEWTTAGDSRVCARCAALEGKIYTLDEIQNMIPLHPNCRCIALPAPVDEVQQRN